ncbi:hypothetical protein ACJ2A9_01790 [Anaerobacillus sp. MEB173]|uniref:hypothetical protein n=1 Tax=Anaerobacillus sp. MEB173 TaxID=3383345 RepID=UPI003F8EDDFC
MVKWWSVINIFFIFAVFIWSWQKDVPSTVIMTGQGIGQIALLFFLLNVNMYFVFLMIRKTKNRKTKKTLAVISRKTMKLHIPIAITGTALILLHATLMISYHTIPLTNFKMVTGYLSFFILVLLLLTGYRRHIKASGFRRKSHIFMAFTFLLMVIIHIFN